MDGSHAGDRPRKHGLDSGGAQARTPGRRGQSETCRLFAPQARRSAADEAAVRASAVRRSASGSLISMNLIIGMVVVIGCVLGGFAVHGGQLLALWQPSELLIIGGAAAGAFLIANPMSVTKRALGGIASLLKG